MFSLLFLASGFLVVWTAFVLFKKDPRDNEIKILLKDMSSDALKLFNNITKLFILLRQASIRDSEMASVADLKDSPNLIELNIENDKDAA